MKISYKVLKDYIPNIKGEEEVAKDLVMHTAEVEDIESEKKAFENIVYWKINSIEAHPDADSLKVCKVNVWENEDIQIVCGGSNLSVGQGVAIAKLGASVLWHGEWEPVVMKKTAIRWVESFWMICASDEVWLKSDFPANDEKEILDISHIKAEAWENLADVLERNDSILEIDNKAINHRPDLFSHIGIIREIYAINWEKFDFSYENKDLSNLKDLGITNEIPELVSRYIWVQINNVLNIETPKYIKQILDSAWVASKGLLIDISNYSLYLYGQPTHCFDADKITWKIVVRKAKDGEKFTALNDSEYELNSSDIVIADDKWVLALGWIIWWKDSAVSENTKNIVVEWAHFEQAVLRKTWKRLWVRTDALNVFEKDLVNGMQKAWVSLIISELEKLLENIELVAYSDIYPNEQKEVLIDFDLSFINRLIWKDYSEEEAVNILKNLGIEIKDNKLKVPFWRKDLNFKADIAEEIARIEWYDNIVSTVPRINKWAVIQDNTYKIKNLTRDYLCANGYYDMYTYSFVSLELMEKTLWNTQDLVPMKNALSEDLTHLRWSLIPNLLLSLEKNIREFPEMKLFELEKVFKRKDSNINEFYSLSGVETSEKDVAYYDIQNRVSDYFDSIGVTNYSFETPKEFPSFSHSGRTANIKVRWKEIWTIWEIHPKVSANFGLNTRIAYFEINATILAEAMNSTVKAKDISSFQENNFDLNFVISKETKASKIAVAIEKTDAKLINKVELVDIYENEEKLPGKRSLTYKIFIQSMESTLDDKVKSELINSIISKVSKVWGELR